MVDSLVATAVGRALEPRQREATEEVERILQAALAVMERVAPSAPRVSDIVAEAGTSNTAFYRYFSSKDDLILAVLQRGIRLAASYVEHEMAKESPGLNQVAKWIEATMAQIGDPQLIRMSRAVVAQFGTVAEHELALPLLELLSGAVVAAKSRNPAHDTDVIFTAVMGTLRRHVASASEPVPGETEHLISFCLKAIDPDVPASTARTRRSERPRARRRSGANS